MQPINILYVGNNPADAALVRGKTSQSAPEFAIDWITTCGEAMEKLSPHHTDNLPYGLVLADTILSDGNAMTLVRFLQEQKIPIPVVVIVNPGDSPPPDGFAENGVTDYIVKDAGYVSSLPAILQRIMRLHRSELARERTEKQLLEAEERYRTVIGSSHDGVVLISEGRCVHVNGRFLQIFGYANEEEIAEKPFRFFVHPGCWERMESYPPGSQDTGVPPARLEIECMKRDGMTVFIDYSAANTTYKGKPAILAFLSDVTGRRETLEALRQSEVKYRNIFENAVEGIFLARPEGGFFEVNPAFARIRGYSSPEEAIAAITDAEKQLWVIKKDLKTYRETLQAHDVIEGLETQTYRKDGSIAWISLSARIIRNKDGTMLYRQGLIEDIDYRKRAEEELYQSRQMLQSILDNIPIRVFWQDKNLVYLGCNNAFAADAGLQDPCQIIGMCDAQLPWKSRAETYLKNGLVVMDRDIPQFGSEEEYIRPDGDSVWLRINRIPLHDKDGKVFGMLGTYEDITATRRYVQELARSNAELEQFAYIASHDLQEPLRMVASYTELLGRRYRGKLDDDANEFIYYAVDGAKRMQQLINDLLAYSRVGTKGKPFAPVESKEAFGQAVFNLTMSIEEHNAVVTSGPMPLVTADHMQLVQLFQNLIANGIKFHGPDPPRIHASAGVQGNDWIFSVQDNGIGIESKYFDRIFLIFQRLHRREEYPGTGIGLAICKKIVERHGGRLWVESEPGQGTIFHFTIPKKGAGLQ
jgi:PAS domain S-box-containing protein